MHLSSSVAEIAPSVSVIELQNVSLSLPGAHGPINILKNIDLSIADGETTAIVGPSGSGKTSLMMLIAGLEAPSSGSLRVCGSDITGWNEDALASFRAQNIGIVFQSFHLIPTMTAIENIVIPLEFNRNLSPGDARVKAAETLEVLGLSHRLDHYPAQLSGGEQQRVAIARAFVTHPRLLLADEPTGNLDHHTGAQVIEWLFHLQQQYRTTLLLITHDPDLAGRCHRMIHLSDGRIL